MQARVHGIIMHACTHPTDSPDSAILALFGMTHDAHVHDSPISCPTWASQSPRTMMRPVTLFWRHCHHSWVPPQARMCTNRGGCYIVTLWCRAACPTSTVSRTPVRHRSQHATNMPLAAANARWRRSKGIRRPDARAPLRERRLLKARNEGFEVGEGKRSAQPPQKIDHTE